MAALLVRLPGRTSHQPRNAPLAPKSGLQAVACHCQLGPQFPRHRLALQLRPQLLVVARPQPGLLVELVHRPQAPPLRQAQLPVE